MFRAKWPPANHNKTPFDSRHLSLFLLTLLIAIMSPLPEVLFDVARNPFLAGQSCLSCGVLV
jgi:hypothetical protein